MKLQEIVTDGRTASCGRCGHEYATPVLSVLARENALHLATCDGPPFNPTGVTYP